MFTQSFKCYIFCHLDFKCYITTDSLTLFRCWTHPNYLGKPSVRLPNIKSFPLFLIFSKLSFIVTLNFLQKVGTYLQNDRRNEGISPLEYLDCFVTCTEYYIPTIHLAELNFPRWSRVLHAWARARSLNTCLSSSLLLSYCLTSFGRRMAWITRCVPRRILSHNHSNTCSSITYLALPSYMSYCPSLPSLHCKRSHSCTLYLCCKAAGVAFRWLLQ